MKPEIHIRVPSWVRTQATFLQNSEAEAPSIASLFASLREQYPTLQEHLWAPDGTLRACIRVAVNNEDMRLLDGENTRLRSGDEVAFLSAIACG